MPQNVYDKASRYAARADPPGFFSWLMRFEANPLRFRGWLDTRGVPLPSDHDRTSDTVGQLDDPAQPGPPWLVVVEFQSRPHPDMFGRMLSYLATFWKASRPDEERGSRFLLGAAVVNLTGQASISQRMECTSARIALELQAVERNLEHESADELLDGVESGRWSRSVLVWVPLMAGADTPALIERWKRLAETEPDRNRRSELAALAEIFSERAGREDLWTEHLRGWNVEESKIVNGWIATGEARGLVQEARSMVLRLGKKRFGPAPVGVEVALQTLTDRDRLEQIAERVLDATSWEDLLDTKTAEPST